MLGAAAIGLAFPLLTGLPGAGENVIPRFASKWFVGKGAEEQPAMQYLVKTQDMEFVAKLHFSDQIDDDQNITVTIHDKKTGEDFVDDLKIGKAYVFEGESDEIKPYIHALDATIFSIRDTVVEPKYLVVGAEWGTTYIGKFTPKLKITDYGDTEFQFGKLKTYTVSYKINDMENKFLIVDNLPLPIQGEFYDIDGNFVYSFELVDLESSLLTK